MKHHTKNSIENEKWNVLHKFTVLFFTCYFILSLSAIPLITLEFWKSFLEFIATSFFNVKIGVIMGGSSDTYYGYIQLFTTTFLAFIIAFTWLLLDKKRKNYKRLWYWITVSIAYFLILVMFSYGFSKVFRNQFPSPGLFYLLVPVGYKSPMGIAWTFMGASSVYTIFAGICEVASAVLLMFRKTRTFGALMCFAVMLNVFLMNLSYDIPVKIMSFQYMFLALLVAFTDFRRIVNVLLLNTSVEKKEFRKPFKNKHYNTIIMVVKGVALILLTYISITDGYSRMKNSALKHSLYGIYKIKTFIKNNDTIPPLETDSTRWKYIIFDHKNYMNVMKMRGVYDLAYYRTKTDTIKKEVVFLNYKDSTEVAKLSYKKTDSVHFTFQGTFKNDSIWFDTRRTDKNDYLLTNRGFHWVNEYPFNR
ncbi:hypothetical protein ACG2LH_03735 [Zhouia sp. PK063]|uniref:hypothetical protein n=1 Tax=Zhouia sp. PK063 TaxID=3373602 RepID=UPI0037A0DE8C